MYNKIRRTENAIAGLITMLEILTMNTNVLVNLSRLNSWPRRVMLPKIATMVNDLEEIVKETNCLEILLNWGNYECLGNWDDEDEGEPCECKSCSGAVGDAELNHKMVKRHVKNIRNIMKAYSEFTEVPMKELTARQLQ